MKTYRIFLASSFELKSERDQFEIFINRENKRLAEKNVFLRLEIWEDINDGFNTTCKQEDYNEYLRKCDIFVMLFWSKVGKYTLQEFDLAYQLLNETGKPHVFVYEKTITKHSATDADKESKALFIKQIQSENKEQFQSQFAHYAELENRFKKSLDELFTKGILTYSEPATLLSPNGAANPNVFIGREDELKEIRKRFNDSGKLMLINAEGGIGKTTLAAKYWNESLYEYKHTAWLFCDNGIVNALKELAPKLNVDLAGMDETQQINVLKHALSGVHDDFLLVLDNANDDDDIRVFRQTFEGFHWHVLITSRCQGVLENEQELPITHLPPPLAKALFERYYKEDSPDFDALLDRLLEAISYNTLLVEIFAKNMKECAELGIKMSDFLEKLENEGLHLGEDSFEIRTEYNIAVKQKAATTDEILDVLYNFDKINQNEDQRFLLLNLAFLPAKPYTLKFINSLLTKSEGRTELTLRKTLKNLTQKGWIGQNDNNYRLSPVIQDLVLYKNKETLDADSEELLDKLNIILASDARNLLNTKLSDAGQYVKLIFQINKSLFSYPSETLANLNFGSGIYFDNVGDLVGNEYAFINYGRIYESLLKKEPENQKLKSRFTISYSRLGDIYEQTGDLKKALSYHQENNKLQNEIILVNPESLDYRNFLAVSYQNLGKIYEKLGDSRKVKLNYEIYNRIQVDNVKRNPLSSEFKNGLAISYQHLGKIYEKKGDLQNAFSNYKEFDRLAKEVFDNEPDNPSYKSQLGISSLKLGGIYEKMGGLENLEKALLFYKKYDDAEKQLIHENPENLSNKYFLAILHSKIGGIYDQKKDWIKALSNYQEFKRLGKEVSEGSPKNLIYKNSYAISVARLGMFYLGQQDLKNSLTYFSESIVLSREIWQATLGQNVEYAFNFALNTLHITSIEMNLIQNNFYPLSEVPDIIKSIKVVRQEGSQALKPLLEKGLLQANQKPLFAELSDKSWYNL